MKKIGIHCILMAAFILLSGCATETTIQSTPSPIVHRKNLEYNAVLSDPVIKKDFREFKKVAVTSRVISTDGYITMDSDDTKKLDASSNVLIDRLNLHYHLDPAKYNIRTFISSNKPNACYQYYSSLKTTPIGKSCESFPASFGSCQLCNNYLDTVTIRSQKIIHARWWDNKRVTALVDTIKLRNGETALVGLELTSID